MTRTGYDYIPAPGEPYYPQGKPTENRASTVIASGSDGDTVVARGTDSNLVRDKKGNLKVTDTNGNRRAK